MYSQSPFPKTPGHILAPLVQRAADHLAEYFGTLRLDQWDLPSGAPGWTLADVLAHLTSSAHTAAANIQRALQGDTSPPREMVVGLPHQNPSISQALAQIARDERQRLGPKLLEVFRERHAKLHQVYASMASGDWERPCFHRIHLQTIRGYTHLRLAEVSYHTWDLKAGLETSPQLLPEVIPTLVEWLPTWFGWGFFPQEPLDQVLRYRFQVGDPEPLAWDVAVLGDRFLVKWPADAPATVTFRCNGETAALVFGSRIPWRRAKDRGVLAVEGAQGQVDAFFRWFRGV